MSTELVNGNIQTLLLGIIGTLVAAAVIGLFKFIMGTNKILAQHEKVFALHKRELKCIPRLEKKIDANTEITTVIAKSVAIMGVKVQSIHGKAPIADNELDNVMTKIEELHEWYKESTKKEDEEDTEDEV